MLDYAYVPSRTLTLNFAFAPFRLGMVQGTSAGMQSGCNTVSWCPYLGPYPYLSPYLGPYPYLGPPISAPFPFCVRLPLHKCTTRHAWSFTYASTSQIQRQRHG